LFRPIHLSAGPCNLENGVTYALIFLAKAHFTGMRFNSRATYSPENMPYML